MIAFLAAVGAVGAAHSASAGGGVRAWSSSTGNNWNKYSQSNVAADLGKCTAVTAGNYHVIVVAADGYSLLPTSNAALTAANAALNAQLNCGDLDGDGKVNGADLGRMLISWGQCQ